MKGQISRQSEGFLAMTYVWTAEHQVRRLRIVRLFLIRMRNAHYSDLLLHWGTEVILCARSFTDSGSEIEPLVPRIAYCMYVVLFAATVKCLPLISSCLVRSQ